jgi:hypothetical protein
MIYMERKSIPKLMTLNETSGKQGIQSYINDIEWNISDYNDMYGKEINRYIVDIEWNIRETGNSIIY